MRAMLIIFLVTQAGCAKWVDPTGALIAADVASVVVFGRGIADIGVSAISGRDCSIVRLDQGLRPRFESHGAGSRLRFG